MYLCSCVVGVGSRRWNISLDSLLSEFPGIITRMSTLRSNLEALLTKVSSLLINNKDLQVKLKCFQDNKKTLIENIEKLIDAAQTNLQENPDEIQHILDQGEATKSKLLSMNFFDQDVLQKTRKCRHFNRGFCKFRNNCNFDHNPEICDDYLRNKLCKRTDCPHRHPKPCRNVKNGERCNWGQNCLYLHIISNETSKSEENSIADNITKSITYSCDICKTTFNCASDLTNHHNAIHEANTCQGTVAVSYTHLTLPTNREV